MFFGTTSSSHGAFLDPDTDCTILSVNNLQVIVLSNVITRESALVINTSASISIYTLSKVEVY